MKLEPSNIQLNDALDTDWQGALAGDPSLIIAVVVAEGVLVQVAL